MLSTLIKNHSHVFDDESEALMDCGYTGAIENGKRIVNQSGTISVIILHGSTCKTYRTQCKNMGFII